MELKSKIKRLLSVLKDRTNLIIFGIVVLVLFSPTWVCGLLGFIVNNRWLLGVAAAYWAFWLAPCTPFWLLAIGITFAIRKIFKDKK